MKLGLENNLDLAIEAVGSADGIGCTSKQSLLGDAVWVGHEAIAGLDADASAEVFLTGGAVPLNRNVWAVEETGIILRSAFVANDKGVAEFAVLGFVGHVWVDEDLEAVGQHAVVGNANWVHDRHEVDVVELSGDEVGHGQGGGDFRRGQDEVATATAGFLSNPGGFTFNLNEKSHHLFHRPAAIGVDCKVEHARSGAILGTLLGFILDAVDDFAVDFSGDFGLQDVGDFLLGVQTVDGAEILHDFSGETALQCTSLHGHVHGLDAEGHFRIGWAFAYGISANHSVIASLGTLTDASIALSIRKRIALIIGSTRNRMIVAVIEIPAQSFTIRRWIWARMGVWNFRTNLMLGADCAVAPHFLTNVVLYCVNALHKDAASWEVHGLQTNHLRTNESWKSTTNEADDDWSVLSHVASASWAVLFFIDVFKSVLDDGLDRFLHYWILDCRKASIIAINKLGKLLFGDNGIFHV